MTRTTAVMPDLDELRRAAEGATPGLWQAFEERPANGSAPDFGVRLSGRTEPFFVDDLEGAKVNAAHIAAWCPANALSVLDVVDDLRDRLAKAEAGRDAMREALQPFAKVTVLATGAVVGLERFWFERAAALVAGQEEASTAFIESDLNPGVDPAKRAITLAADRIAALLLEEANHDVRQGMVLAKQAVMRGIVLKAVDGQEAGR